MGMLNFFRSGGKIAWALVLAEHWVVNKNGGIIVAALIGIVLLAGLRERAEGWRIALGVLAVFVLYSILT